MADVVLEQVTKVYPNGVRAVSGVNLQAASGELVVVVGPSGCGKTTLLRLIAGLEEPTAGVLLIDGRAVNSVPPARRGVALVFQRPALYPHLRVRENLDFSLKLSGGHSAGLIAQRTREIAQVLGLDTVLDRRPGELSGGQQQRVALGRALVRRPAVTLLDEPFSNLDGPLRAELRRELHLLQQRFAATMIYVTHDQVEAMILADRLVVLREGVVQQSGRPNEVYQHPANRFVAGFVGWLGMNLLSGRLEAGDGGLRFVGPENSLTLPQVASPAWAALAGRPLQLGIRPEDIQVRTETVDNAALVDVPELRLQVQVALVEPLGGGSLVTGHCGGWRLTAFQASPSESAVRDQTMELRFSPDRVHWFDDKDGHALTGG